MENERKGLTIDDLLGDDIDTNNENVKPVRARATKKVMFNDELDDDGDTEEEVTPVQRPRARKKVAVTNSLDEDADIPVSKPTIPKNRSALKPRPKENDDVENDIAEKSTPKKRKTIAPEFVCEMSDDTLMELEEPKEKSISELKKEFREVEKSMKPVPRKRTIKKDVEIEIPLTNEHRGGKETFDVPIEEDKPVRKKTVRKNDSQEFPRRASSKLAANTNSSNTDDCGGYAKISTTNSRQNTRCRDEEIEDIDYSGMIIPDSLIDKPKPIKNKAINNNANNNTSDAIANAVKESVKRVLDETNKYETKVVSSENLDQLIYEAVEKSVKMYMPNIINEERERNKNLDFSKPEDRKDGFALDEKGFRITEFDSMPVRPKKAGKPLNKRQKVVKFFTKNKIGVHLKNWTIRVAVLLLLWHITVTYLIGTVQVSGLSMYPTYCDSETLLIDKVSTVFKEPERNDVLVFNKVYDGVSKRFIKRVIALPGETVQIVDGLVYIDDEQLKDDDIYEPMKDAGVFAEKYTLKSNEYLVLGDNRNNSIDSRDPKIGLISDGEIVGTVMIKLKSVDSLNNALDNSEVE